MLNETLLVLDDGSNASVWKYLEVQLGPQYMPTSIVLPITVLYLLIFISGVLGNIIVCKVILKNSHFQTPTNYYLFSLAISDLLILIFGLPNDLKVYWQQYPWELGETVCKFRALIAEMTSYASVLTIVAFTLERYIAICHPLFIQTVSTLPRAVRFIASVWIVSLISATPFAYLTKVNYIDYPLGSGHYLEESAFCGLPMEIQHITRPLLQFATFAFFCLPLTVIIIFYVKISLKLRSTKFARVTYKTRANSSTFPSDSCSSTAESRKIDIRRSVNKMLIAVVIAFFICWAPFHAQRLLAVYVAPNDWTIMLRTINEILYYAAGCFYYFSATVNPILYTLMSSKYRVAFKDALCTGNTQKSAIGTYKNTTHQRSEMAHSEKEPSLRISKQSFEADKIQTDNKVSNQLEIPGGTGNLHKNLGGTSTTETYVTIGPQGELGDAIGNGCSEEPHFSKKDVVLNLKGNRCLQPQERCNDLGVKDSKFNEHFLEPCLRKKSETAV